MHTGLLWFDNDPQATLSVKVQKAIAYYFKKYGRNPDLCLVHPSMLEADQRQFEFGKVVIRGYRPVMPGHFWIVTEDQK